MHKTMMYLKLVVLLCLALTAVYADKEVVEGDVNVKVLGKSGKIRITTQGGKDVNIEMDSMKEMDASGNEVGKSGSTKHSFNTFASQDFEFRENVDFLFYGINATKIEFYASNLVEHATLTVPLIVFRAHGMFTVGNTEYRVYPGNIKFNFEVLDWSFCGHDVSCKQGNTDEVGEYIEFVITIKGTGSGKEVDPDPEEDWVAGQVVYDLGGGERLYMTKEISRDGIWEQMRSGYPGYTVQGSKQHFSFAIPRFSSNSTYDPSINMMYREDGSGCAAFTSSLLAFCFSLLLSLTFH